MTARAVVTHRQAPALNLVRVVVLGATGFVGADLVRQLSTEGVPVVAVGSSDIDLRAHDSVAALEARLHPDDPLVVVSALTPDRGRDIDTLMANLLMGQHVAAVVAKTRCAHVVYVSSDAVYEDVAEEVSETTCAAPTTLHGVMHVTRERMLRHALGGTGVPLCILRPSLLFGAGDPHNAYGPNRFLRTARADGVITLFGGGEEQRDHVWIRDVSRLTELVLRHRTDGVLNVATGRSLSFREVAERVTRIYGRSVRLEGRPRSGAITHRRFDVSALATAFPDFQYTPFEEALAATVREGGVTGAR
jgi:UDP-glucose 4-epimerase